MVLVLESPEYAAKADMIVQGVTGWKASEQTECGVRVRAGQDGVSSVTCMVLPLTPLPYPPPHY